MTFRPKTRAVLLSVLLGSSVLAGLPQAIAAPPLAPTVVPTQPNGFSDLVRHVKAAVVTITSSEVLPNEGGNTLFGRPGPSREEGRLVRGLGSGFIIDEAGHIVTNNHVVDGARRITVTLDDGRTLPARVVGRDPRTDIALLKIDAGGPLPYVALGDSDRAEPGDWVVAVGNPYGLGGTVTAGVVSARGRSIGQGPYDDFIQVDAPINRGNSGGPLFSQDGKVIGVNTAIFSPNGGSIGIGFAVPSNMVAKVVAQLQQSGRVERGFLGVTTQPVDQAMASALHLPQAGGALVADVSDKGPAALAGIRPGDVITSVNGATMKDARDLARAVADIRPGQATRIGILRDGRTMEVTATVVEPPDAQQANAGGEEANSGRIGVALTPLTPQVRRALGLSDTQSGAVIGQVVSGSPADEAGLRAGDLIVAVGAKPVASPDDAVREIRAAIGNGGSVALRVMRDGAAIFVAVDSKAAG